MLTKEQNTLLDSFKPLQKRQWLSQEDYDIMGLYGSDYCQFDEDYEEEEDYDE